MSESCDKYIKELIGVNITMVAWIQELGLHNQEVLIKQLTDIKNKLEEENVRK